jgi:hypothetical protein
VPVAGSGRPHSRQGAGSSAWSNRSRHLGSGGSVTAGGWFAYKGEGIYSRSLLAAGAAQKGD